MPTLIASFDAKQKLPELLNRANGGEEFVITRNGVPIAKLSPLGETRDFEAAKRNLLASLALQTTLNLPKVSRDQIYERSEF